ncbi:SMP-30/gluconolactonase/LRE family protein [Chitinophaga silvatica]|uniref:SMP-30/gluconolactonase/LRE family protein n=1 Tax=Chitinophaga silvatica TaxID=2282649 RepID=A0A3E1Y3X1_9BACT|nr:SMP-30/gluconolactonase/LRE family protein [Chitinophaga silvatica]RFS19378.1 SMP-30/gluconolactonase/LRE family protein [Chitinophaga silvatica]
MQFKLYSTLLLSIAYCQLSAQSMPPTVEPNAAVVLVSSQFAFTEGPAADKKGNIYFTDQPNNAIWKYDRNGKLSKFLEPAGRSNGLYLDRKGNIIACADEKDELWLITPKKEVKVLVNNFGNHRLNGPNDVWIAPNGGIYFTDPYYQRDYWDRKSPDIKEQRVYYLAPGATEPIIAAEDIKKPNGVIGSSDGKRVFIADIEAGKVYSYTVGADGKLINQQLVTKFTTDGMTLDEEGNLYMCGNGVKVVNKDGQDIGHIPVPESWTANVCFGGKDNKLLFITAGKSIYTVKMKVRGDK